MVNNVDLHGTDIGVSSDGSGAGHRWASCSEPLRSAATLVAAGVRENGIHAATITIAGSVVRGTAFDPDNIAELFWSAHTDPSDAWQTEYRFTGA